MYYAEHVHTFLFELCLVNMLHFLKSILEAGPDGDPKCATSKGIGSAKQAVPGASGHVTHFAMALSDYYVKDFAVMIFYPVIYRNSYHHF